MKTYWGHLLRIGILAFTVSACTSGFDSRFTNRNETALKTYTIEDLQRFDKGSALYYSKRCVECHGELQRSVKRGVSGKAIFDATKTVSSMKSIQLTADETAMIAFALSESRERILAGIEVSGPEPLPPAPAIPSISYNERQFQCVNPSDRGKADIEMQRLTKQQLINTWSDAFGSGLISNLTTTVRLPDEHYGPDEYQLSPFMQKQKLEALFLVSQEIAAKVSSDVNALGNIHNCLKTEINNTTLSDNCLSQAISILGTRLFRRPLNDNEISRFTGVAEDIKTALPEVSAKSQISLLISRMLLTPQSQYIFPTWTETIDGRTVIGWSTVIQRLSYGITDGPPDAELLADYNQMSNMEVIRRHALRLAETPRGRAKFRKVMRSWLRLDEAVEVSSIPGAEFGVTEENTKSLLEEMKTEALDYAEYIAFEHTSGTVEDLLTQPLGFPKSESMRKILGASELSKNGSPVAAPNHLGVLNRPALLADSSQKGNVIHRGLVYRLHFLCDSFNPEDIPTNTNEIFEQESQKIDFFNSTARDLAYAGTSSPNCIGCHQTINSIGYALGNFGPLGQYQAEEKVFKENGEFLKTLPIDSSATDTRILSSSETVSGHIDLAQKMAASHKFKACFSKHILRRTRGRVETGWDQCQLAELETALHNREKLLEVYLRSIVSDDIFWKGL